jgi:hypothetical protein
VGGLVKRIGLIVILTTSLQGFAHSEDLSLLKHDDFYSLSNPDQQEYIMLMRKMMNDLSQTNVLIDTVHSGQLQNWIDSLLGASFEQSFAQNYDCSNLDFSTNNADKISIKNSNTGRVYSSVQAVSNVIQACQARFNEQVPQITQSQSKTYKLEEIAMARARAKLTNQINTVEKINNTSKTAADIPKDAFSKSLAHDWKKEASIDKLDVNCIYAGFVIEKGKKCEPQSEIKIRDKTYKCPVAGADKSESVLCHPMLFGLSEQNNALCVKRSKNATADCLKKSEQADPEASKARALLAGNKNEYQKLAAALKKICSLSREEIVTKLKRSERSARDLHQTCIAYGDRFNTYAPVAREGSSGSAGNR